MAFGACSGTAATAAPTAAPTSAPATAAGGGTTAVSIKNFKFDPDPSTAKAGGSVEWTNNDSTAHTITFDDASIKSSANVDASGKFSTTFAAAGSFAYHCKIHPTMKGTVTVS